MSVFRGQILWRFSLSKINISPAAPDLKLILFPLWYWPIMNAHTKQQQDKVFETDFIGSQNPYPTQCTPFVTKSYIYISSCYIFLLFQITRQRVFRLHVLIFWQVDEWLKLGELGSVTRKNRLRRSKPSGHLLKKVNKPARNLPVPVKGWDLTTYQWKMLIAMEGPQLEATESSAVIHWVCTEFCSMHERRKLN